MLREIEPMEEENELGDKPLTGVEKLTVKLTEVAFVTPPDDRPVDVIPRTVGP